jgi:hypothetical protein
MTNDQAPMTKIDITRHDIPAIEELIDGANEDSDAVSIYVLGDTLEDNQGAVLIIKGAVAFNLVRNFCVRQELLTPGKPVRDLPAENVSASVDA